MGTLKRSLKSLIRSPMRTFFTIILLALSVGLALTMLTVNGAFQNQMDAVKSRVGNDITVRPAGSFALLGGGEPIKNEDIDKISSFPHVVSVQKTAQSFYTGNSLESSINAGRLGRRATNWLGSQFSKMPIIAIGFEPSETSPMLLGGARATIIQGRYFNLDESDADVAILGEALATKNGLDVGSIVNINGSELAVIGIDLPPQVIPLVKS